MGEAQQGPTFALPCGHALCETHLNLLRCAHRPGPYTEPGSSVQHPIGVEPQTGPLADFEPSALYRLSPAKWPGHYLYMQDNSEGNVRGWHGDPGPQGWFRIQSVSQYETEGGYMVSYAAPYFHMRPARWDTHYVYMQNKSSGNVRGWEGDPGPQGHFAIVRNPKQSNSFLLTAKRWEHTWFVYMQDNSEGNVRAWQGDPGDQGWWMIERVPEEILANEGIA